MRVHQKPFNNPKAKAIITGIVEVVLQMSLWSQIESIEKKHFGYEVLLFTEAEFW